MVILTRSWPGVTTVVYTYLGRMRAVLWSDLIQFVLYLGGALVAFWAIQSRLPLPVT